MYILDTMSITLNLFISTNLKFQQNLVSTPFGLSHTTSLVLSKNWGALAPLSPHLSTSLHTKTNAWYTVTTVTVCLLHGHKNVHIDGKHLATKTITEMKIIHVMYY